LLCLIPLEQFIDENPWEGLRFGALSPSADGSFRGATWLEHTYGVTIGPNKTELVRDGTIRFQADNGVVVRNYVVSSTGLSMKVNSERDFHVTTAEFDSGNLNLIVDGKTIKKIRVVDGKASCAIPAGQHVVELTETGQEWGRSQKLIQD
jgi:hypothetical protein